MKYLLLGYYDPAAFDALPDEEKKALGPRCRPHDERFFGTGKVLDVASLQHPLGAHIRPGPEGPSITDGPFAEAREVVGSYFLIEADSLEHATEIASLHPAAQIGWEVGFSMEVRPVETVWVKDGAYVGPPKSWGDDA
ncbi:YciI family protein [soil metagenome]